MRPLILILPLITITVICTTNNFYNKNSKFGDSYSDAYDTIVKPYVPLPCAKGIELEKLYGTWRSIGDEYNDDTFKYWINKIDTAGNWILDKVDTSKIIHKYSGKIKSINKKNHTIDVKSNDGITTLEIMNLTENCFEYRLKANKNKVWRLGRMK